MTTTPILVLGATGKTGRRITDRLRAAGHPVRALSRPDFEWGDPRTWAPALGGVRAAYLAYAPDLAAPGAAETVAAFAREAAGLERLVLLSGRGEPEAQRAEELVRAATPQATVLRCSFFTQNFTEGAWAEEVRSGTLALPVGDVREPFVDCDDIAEVAVAALTEPGHAGVLHELTGPAALTFAEAAACFGATHVQVTLEEWRAAMRSYAVPEDVIGLLTLLFIEVLDGRNAAPTDGVQRALGRPASALSPAAAAPAPSAGSAR